MRLGIFCALTGCLDKTFRQFRPAIDFMLNQTHPMSETKTCSMANNKNKLSLKNSSQISSSLLTLQVYQKLIISSEVKNM